MPTADEVGELVRRCVGTAAEVTAGLVWTLVVPDGPVPGDSGWKLHVSSRAATFVPLLETLLPVLVEARCPFKLAGSVAVLEELNDGRTSPAGVGKAVTIYPEPARVRELGLALAELLRGYDGPRVLSDRRVADSSPVYYRYGPLNQDRPLADPQGRSIVALHGPAGESFAGEAGLRYRQPSWAVDPFTGETGSATAAENPDAGRLGDHYRVVDGIREAAQGNVYRAVDERDDGSVVIKQGRAFVAEYAGNDARLRLRNERRVLAVLAGLDGVPRFVDHFRQGDDEFLVTTDGGPTALAEDVRAHGPWAVAGSSGSGTDDSGTDGAGGSGVGGGRRDLRHLAGALVSILREIHGRGVVMRDLSPANVVLDGDRPTIVDFGLAGYDGLHLPGGTPGYGPVRQLRDDGPPAPRDDFHALGMTLLFAATGLDPVIADDDPELPVLRARQLAGTLPGGFRQVVAQLLDDDPRTQQVAIDWLSGVPVSLPPVRLPAVPAVDGELLRQITGNLYADLLQEVDRALAAPAEVRSSHDAGIHGGAAGIGLELLRHEPIVPELAELAEFARELATAVRLPPGLFGGATGVSVFLHEAALRGVPVNAGSALPPAGWEPTGNDLISGAAGVGLGHLRLHQLTGTAEHLAVVRKCFVALTGQPWQPEAMARGTGLDSSLASAHGLAGGAEFLLALAAYTGDPDDLAAAAHATRELADHVTPLARAAALPTANRLAASWCQGLTGVARTLLRASDVLREPAFLATAIELAWTCGRLVPRLSNLGQCCGAAGVGTLFVELAIHERDDRYWHAADAVAGHLVSRMAGPPDHPRLTERATDLRTASWAMGLAGLLTLFRRLAARGGPDCLPFW